MPTGRAGDLRAALATSTRLATEVDAVLGRYEAGLGRVLKTVRPTVERTQVGGGERERGRGEGGGRARRPLSTSPPSLSPILFSRPSPHVLPGPQALRAARAEVRAALADAELTLHHLDTPRRVEAAVLAGPEADLPAFLRALADLGAATAFLDPRKGDLPAAEAAVDSAQTLRRDGLALALRNFVTLLQLHRGDGGEEEGGEGGGGEVEGGGGRWRPSEEGVPGGGEEDAAAAAAAAAALDYDSEEGSEADSGDRGDQGGAAAADDPSPFLRVADFDADGGGGPGARPATIMPPPVTARLHALADAMVAAGNAAQCVKVS